MQRFFQVLSVVVLIGVTTGTSQSQDFYVYPRAGQDSQAMEKDKYECYQWARQQTGFDPNQGPSSYPSQGDPYARSGEIARGAARGAVGGAVVGGIAGDAGKGAAIGAASGGMIGGVRRRDRIRSNQSTQQQHQQNYEHNRSTYNRAYSACLDARDYSVK
ncbi:MAG: glycine zipper family protein [Desulfocapsaceae bacterium]